MSNTKIVKLTNRIGIFSIILLVYWVFTFILITVFDFKVFKENMTNSFYYSILGILALMIGSLIVNVMINMTIIAQRSKINKTEAIAKKGKLKWLFLLSFPVIFGLLFLGDLATKSKKERFLKQSAEYSINEFSSSLNTFVNTKFGLSKLEKARDLATLIEGSSINFNRVSIIAEEKVLNRKMFLSYGRHFYIEKNKNIDKIEFVLKTDTETKEYLKSVFNGKNKASRFSAHKSKVEMFIPYFVEDKCIVLYFENYSSYGKFGS